MKSNSEIEGLLTEELKRATKLITDNIVMFKTIVNLIIKKTTVTQDEFIEILSEKVKLTKTHTDGEFVRMWENHSINS